MGHITKDGKVAGPKLLEHMVDAVFSFEGEEGLFYRILRSTKIDLALLMNWQFTAWKMTE